MNQNMELFLRDIRSRLQEIYGEETEIRLQEVCKNNHVMLHGITILEPGQAVSPTLYLDDFYRHYQRGTSLETILEKIQKIYRENVPREQPDMAFFQDFEKVKDRIAYRLVHRGRNRELLERVPHVSFLDLAVCFSYIFHSEELGDGTILIHNTHMEMWQSDTETLMRLAEANTPRLFPLEILSMGRLLQEMLGGTFREENPGGSECRGEGDVYVMTNQKRFQGACSLLYPGSLEQAARILGGSYYVIPSSVHEVLLIREEGQDPGRLHEMIREVNREQLRPEEVLADYPYYYDREEKKLILPISNQNTI